MIQYGKLDAENCSTKTRQKALHHESLKHRPDTQSSRMVTSDSPKKLKHYWRTQVSEEIMNRLGCISNKPVTIARLPVQLKGYWLSHHSFYHLEVSCLERISVAGARGIHGFYSLMFHDRAITP